MVISSIPDYHGLNGTNSRVSASDVAGDKSPESARPAEGPKDTAPAGKTDHASAVARTRGLIGEMVRADAALQVADAAYREIGETLVEMRGVAEQATDEALSTQDRALLNHAFQELKASIDRTAEETEFDGEKILLGGDGPDGEFVIHLSKGGEGGEGVDITIPSATVKSIAPGLVDANLLTKKAADEAVKITDGAIEEVARRREHIAQQRGFLQQMMATERQQNALLSGISGNPGSSTLAAQIASSVSSIVAGNGDVPLADSAERLRAILDAGSRPSAE